LKRGALVFIINAGGLSCVRSEKVITSRAVAGGAQNLGRGALVFIIYTSRLVAVRSKIIIAVNALAGGAQDWKIGITSTFR